MIKLPPQLSDCQLGTPEDVCAWITAQVPCPARLTGLSLFCTSDLPDRVLCLIGFADANANEIANALRGQAFGFSSVVVTLPIGASFTCRCRQSGRELKISACSCHPVQRNVSSWLDRD